MKTTFSKIVLIASCIVTLLTIAATCEWIYCAFGRISDADGRLNAGLGLTALAYLVAPVLGGVSLGCMIASGIFFFRRRERLDLWSLCLSGGSFFCIVGQVAYLICLAYS